jgi:hypothetical protein
MKFEDLRNELLNTGLLIKGGTDDLEFSNARLSRFFRGLNLQGGLSEWGAPAGQMGRLIPCLVVKAFAAKCLWVSSYENSKIYPPYWHHLGINMSKVYFLYDESPLKDLRFALREAKFKVIVIDIDKYVSPSDMNFLAKIAQKNGFSILLLRKYFLSSKNGNPFSRIRLNCSYSIRSNSIALNLIKGPKVKRVTIGLEEVLDG